MRYVLDFDEVIFNTTALKEKMKALNIGQDQRGLSVFDAIQEADPEFDFTSLVFDGARAFLEEFGDQVSVVSSAFSIDPQNNTDEKAQLEFQLEKILRAGVGQYVPREHIHVVGTDKSEALSELQSRYGDAMVFVDDREKYIKQAERLGIRSVWLDRSSEASSEFTGEAIPVPPPFPRVANFEQLREVLASWEKQPE